MNKQRLSRSGKDYYNALTQRDILNNDIRKQIRKAKPQAMVSVDGGSVNIVNEGKGIAYAVEGQTSPIKVVAGGADAVELLSAPAVGYRNIGHALEELLHHSLYLESVIKATEPRDIV